MHKGASICCTQISGTSKAACAQNFNHFDICLNLIHCITTYRLIEYVQALNSFLRLLVTSLAMAGNFIIEAWTELGIAVVFILMRLYFRFSQNGLSGMALDDFLMILAGASILEPSYAPH